MFATRGRRCFLSRVTPHATHSTLASPLFSLPPRAPAVVEATSLAEAYAKRATATLLRVPPRDAACVNVFCEHVGRGCACRLSLALERMPALEALDVRACGLPALPWAALASRPRLRVVLAAGNRLAGALPRPAAWGAGAGAAGGGGGGEASGAGAGEGEGRRPAGAPPIEALDLADNRLTSVDVAALLAALPRLSDLRLEGNPLDDATRAAVEAARGELERRRRAAAREGGGPRGGGAAGAAAG